MAWERENVEEEEVKLEMAEEYNEEAVDMRWRCTMWNRR